MLATDPENKLIPPGPNEAYDLHATQESFDKVSELISTYGDICRVHSVARSSDSYLINNPEYIKHVLVKNHTNYTKGVGFERVKLLLGNGIIVSDGPFWRRQRRMIQPAFSRQLIASLVDEMRDCNAILLEDWRQKVETGGLVNITEVASELALRIVLRTIFGDDLEFINKQSGGNPFAILTEDSARDMQLVLKYRALRKVVLATIEMRREQGIERDDFLGAFMAAKDKDSGETMTNNELIDEVMTLIVAGHETSACTLNWVWYLLAQDPVAEQKVQSEADLLPPEGPQFTDLTEMPYSKQVVEEALRLYPPVWLFSRKCLKDDRLGEYFVPAGTDIFIAPYFLHRSSEHWPDPDIFNPDRFAGEVLNQRHKQAFIPFSAGPRRCIGDFFATVEMQIHMGMMAREFRLVHVPDKPLELAPDVNLRTRHNFMMRIEKR